MLVGSYWSGGDYSSQLQSNKAPRGLAFSTVTVPLAKIETLSGGMFIVSSMKVENTLVGLASLGMTRKNEERLYDRVTYGGSVFYMPPKFRAWTVENTRPMLTCPVCEPRGWDEFGVRTILCFHQIPFTSACWACGHVLTPRVPGAAPAVHCPEVACREDLCFAQTGQALAIEANKRNAVAERLVLALQEAGYCCPGGASEYRLVALAADFGGFCNAFVRDPRLRNLTQIPNRAKKIVDWLRYETGHTHPVYVILLDCFVKYGGEFGFSPPARKSNSRFTLLEESKWSGWRFRASYRSRELPVDGGRRYVRDDLPALVKAGCTIQQMAQITRLHKSTVQQYIVRHELSAIYTRTQFEVVRNEARTAWLGLRSEFPKFSVHALQVRNNEHLVRWLERNDHAWLNRHSYKRSKHKLRNAAHTSKGQFSGLAARIRRAVKDIKARQPAQWCNLLEISRETGISLNTMRMARMQPKIQNLLFHSVEPQAQFHARKRYQSA
ncbi:TnsD family Tn7-like transposition protein [Cupriavidus phytorum]